MSYKCPKCGSQGFAVRENISVYCLNCGWYGKTIFDCITTSPEVLAPNLVYSREFVWGDDCGNEETETKWLSTVCDDRVFCDEAEAIAATVVRLNEIYNETTSN